MNRRAQQQAERIDEDLTLAAFDLFAGLRVSAGQVLCARKSRY